MLFTSFFKKSKWGSKYGDFLSVSALRQAAGLRAVRPVRMGISCVAEPDEAAAYSAVATQRFLSSLKGSKSELQQSRVAVTTMHQWQRSSSPNCKVVQRGAELLGLDCAAVGGGGVQNGGVASRRKKRQKSERYKWDDRGWGWGVAGTESRTEWRKGRAKLVPFSCQHISSHCPPPHPIFKALCQSQSTAQMRLWATSLEEI